MNVRSILKGVAGWFGAGRKTTSRPSVRRASLTVEGLEQRDVPTAVTVGALANAVAGQIRADAQRLVRDAAAIEIVYPTAARGAITSDLVALNNAVKYGSVDAIFSASARLGRDAVLEAQLTGYYHLRQAPLANYTAFQRDVVYLVRDKLVANALVAFVVQHQQKLNVPPAPTGLFAAGTSGGDLQAALAAQYANAVQNYHPSGSPGWSSSNWVAAQDGIMAANANFSSIAQNLP